MSSATEASSTTVTSDMASTKLSKHILTQAGMNYLQASAGSQTYSGAALMRN